MQGCCDHSDLDRSDARQRRVLQAVLAINAAMFLGEFGAGLAIGSSALLGDSLDMLGDALVYGVSLYALGMGERWSAGSAALKGGAMALFGFFVLIHAAFELMRGTVPHGGAMAGVAALALAANAICFALLYRHRAGDLNMRSSWLCSRNDLIANLGVLLAAALVQVTGTLWPDILVGLAIAGLFLWSAFGVLRQSAAALQRPVRS